jgi:hypothetical protein
VKERKCKRSEAERALTIVNAADTELLASTSWLVGKPQFVLSVRAVVDSKYFLWTIVLAIIANALILASDHYGIDP